MLHRPLAKQFPLGNQASKPQSLLSLLLDPKDQTKKELRRLVGNKEIMQMSKKAKRKENCQKNNQIRYTFQINSLLIPV